MSQAAGRLGPTLELIDLTERMLRHRLRREDPSLSDEDIEARVIAWYQTRPGAEHGDADGIPVPWPRRR